MKCAKCGNEAPQGAAQCPSCGGREFVEAQVRQGTKPIVYVIAGLAAVIIIALVVAVIAGGRKNVATAPPPSAGPASNVVTAPPPGPAGGNVVTAPPANPAPGVPSAPAAAAKPKPPQELLDYLAHVEKVDKHRRKLAKDTAAAFTLAMQGVMGLMVGSAETGKDPWAPVKTELGRQRQNWLSTLRYFDQKPAPTQCREFSGAYRALLVKETKAKVDVAKSVDAIDPQRSADSATMLGPLQEMLGGAQESINDAVGLADAKLTALVAQYDMSKPFDVYRETSTDGSILSVPIPNKQ